MTTLSAFAFTNTMSINSSKENIPRARTRRKPFTNTQRSAVFIIERDFVYPAAASKCEKSSVFYIISLAEDPPVRRETENVIYQRERERKEQREEERDGHANDCRMLGIYVESRKQRVYYYIAKKIKIGYYITHSQSPEAYEAILYWNNYVLREYFC